MRIIYIVSPGLNGFKLDGLRAADAPRIPLAPWPFFPNPSIVTLRSLPLVPPPPAPSSSRSLPLPPALSRSLSTKGASSDVSAMIRACQ